MDRLSLAHIQVHSERAERVCKKVPVKTIVSRAVGQVGLLYSWVRPSKSWESLILFKGPGWKKEWDSFQKTPFAKELFIAREHSYHIPVIDRSFVLVELKRC